MVADFRSADVAAGGEGAPLAPLYHAALAARLAKPLAVLNLGGVGNVTWIGAGGADILAFDTGPGNALLDDWVRRHTGGSARPGRGAGPRRRRVGGACRAVSRRILISPASRRNRSTATISAVSCRPISRRADGAATLTEMTAAAVAAARAPFPGAAREWLVCGGGRHNPALMAALARRLAAPVRPVEAVGWDGDALEAQAFAYLAVRSMRGLPLSLPSTTGAPAPIAGGRLFRA